MLCPTVPYPNGPPDTIYNTINKGFLFDNFHWFYDNYIYLYL